MDEELRELENQLEKLSPQGMPADMVSRMLEAMDRWQETVPAEEKIVPFQKAENAGGGGVGRFNVWATAAAVALMGAVGVVMMSPMDGRQGGEVASEAPKPAESSVDFLMGGNTVRDKNVVGVSNGVIDREVADEPSQKIVFDREGRPHRLVRIEFKDKLTLENKEGNKVLVEKPRVEYYLVPVHVE